MALLDDLKTRLVDQNVVDGSTGWTLSLSYTPPTPDKVVVLTETVGNISDQTSGTGHDFPSFQAMIRGEKFGYAAAQTKAKAVFDALNQAAVDNTIYVYANQAPFQIGMDDNDRPLLVINFNCMKAR